MRVFHCNHTFNTFYMLVAWHHIIVLKYVYNY
uniref:Uncharacterized protein n=1 Tax=Rhizophora mucronata TaxID=61149 RepID=A0A2P2PZF4_RHIMU